MDILLILGGLLMAFVVASWSCANSYFEKGRLRGMEEATREIVRGSSSHYELEGQTFPERVARQPRGSKPSLKSAGKKVRGRPILTTRSFGYLATRLARPVGSRATLPA